MSKLAPGDPNLNAAGGRAPADTAYSRIAQDCWSAPASWSSNSSLTNDSNGATCNKEMAALGFPAIDMSKLFSGPDSTTPITADTQANPAPDSKSQTSASDTQTGSKPDSTPASTDAQSGAKSDSQTAGTGDAQPNQSPDQKASGADASSNPAPDAKLSDAAPLTPANPAPDANTAKAVDAPTSSGPAAASKAANRVAANSSPVPASNGTSNDPNLASSDTKTTPEGGLSNNENHQSTAHKSYAQLEAEATEFLVNPPPAEWEHDASGRLTSAGYRVSAAYDADGHLQKATLDDTTYERKGNDVEKTQKDDYGIRHTSTIHNVSKFDLTEKDNNFHGEYKSVDIDVQGKNAQDFVGATVWESKEHRDNTRHDLQREQAKLDADYEKRVKQSAMMPWDIDASHSSSSSGVALSSK
jgi:hypothetical protein